MNNKEDNADGLSQPIDVSASGMHIVAVPTGEVADNPLSPDKIAERKPTKTYQNIVISPDNRYLVDANTGDVAENPLDISDPVKRDNVAVMQRKTTIWVAHLLVLGVFAGIAYGQLFCTPCRDFNPPAEIWGIILGIYCGSSVNVINKIMAVRASLRKKE